MQKVLALIASAHTPLEKMGELIELPKQPTSSGIQRSAKLSLDATGKLLGQVEEVRLGEDSRSQRWALRTVMNDSDRIKPIERMLASSLAAFRITSAKVLRPRFKAVNHRGRRGHWYTFWKLP